LFYKAVLDLNIFDSTQHQADWEKVIETRHHRVHRNGRDQEGNLILLSDNDVEVIRNAVTAMYARIEAAAVKYDLSTITGPAVRTTLDQS
jgi:hypothetical protein